MGRMVLAKVRSPQDSLPIPLIHQILKIQMIHPDPDEEEDEEAEKNEEDQKEEEEGAHKDGEEEEAKEVDEAEEIVESESTKKKRKIAERKVKVDEATMTRLPYSLSEQGPLYKGVEIAPHEKGDAPSTHG